MSLNRSTHETGSVDENVTGSSQEPNSVFLRSKGPGVTNSVFLETPQNAATMNNRNQRYRPCPTVRAGIIHTPSPDSFTPMATSTPPTRHTGGRLGGGGPLALERTRGNEEKLDQTWRSNNLLLKKVKESKLHTKNKLVTLCSFLLPEL